MHDLKGWSVFMLVISEIGAVHVLLTREITRGRRTSIAHPRAVTMYGVGLGFLGLVWILPLALPGTRWFSFPIVLTAWALGHMSLWLAAGVMQHLASQPWSKPKRKRKRNPGRRLPY